mmetsp:Transcript_12316/g.24398  ORF Transcript_12316/g.24398 Transcript_12316/m.24398 type:complete len:239 (-) Transcript_12316:395-1111(-)
MQKIEATDAKALVDAVDHNASVLRFLPLRKLDLQLHADPYQLLYKLGMVTEEITRRHGQWKVMSAATGDCSEWEVEDSALRFTLCAVEVESVQYQTVSESRPAKLSADLKRLSDGLAYHECVVARHGSGEGGWNQGKDQTVTPSAVQDAVDEARRVLTSIRDNTLDNISSSHAVKQLKAGAQQLQAELEEVQSDLNKVPLTKPCMPYRAKEVDSLQFWLESYLHRAVVVFKRVADFGC